MRIRLTRSGRWTLILGLPIVILVYLLAFALMARATTCDTVAITWTGETPGLDSYYPTIDGMRMAAVGDYLWIDYDGAIPDSYDPDLTTPMPDGVTSVTVCAGDELTIDFGKPRDDSPTQPLITPTTTPAPEPIVIHYGFRGAVK